MNLELPDLPSTWGYRKLSRFVQPARRITYGIVQAGPDVPNPNGIPYIRPTDMDDETGTSLERLQRTTPEIAYAYRRSSVRAGDLVFSIGPSYGKIMVVPSELEGANLTQGTARIAVDERQADARYVFWCLRSGFAVGQWDAAVGGATFRALNLGPLCETLLPSPGLEIQRAIADFLDRKTAAIDALIAKKERLIELLEEKRQALITRAVTKGLDPNVPMKDSGIEWLGQIPAHWADGPLRRWWAVIDCKHRTVEFTNDGYPVASIGEVHGLEVELSSARRTPFDDYAQMIDGGRRPVVGDIIYSRNATVGEAAYVASTEPFCLGQDVSLIRSAKEHGRFLVHQLRSRVVRDQVEAVMVGSTFRRINVAAIKSLTVCRPPRQEQLEIAEYCDGVQARSDLAATKLEQSVGRLQEYRQALITAAVTGKIEVPGAA